VHLLVDLRAGSGAVEPHVSAVAARFSEDQEPSPITSAALAQPRSIQRTVQHMNGITVQFLNRAKWPWYTKPLINLVSWLPSNERQFDSERFDRCAD
jgi:hypothetical protein